MTRLVALSAACASLALSGCAISAAFKPNPTADECARAQEGLPTAQIALALATSNLQALKALGVDPKVIDKAQTGVDLAQSNVSALQALAAAHCTVKPLGV